MKLTHLTLGAFRSARDLALSLDAPRILIAGVNASGKTSVAAAIAWGLTGVCRTTAARGAGAEVLIPAKAKTAEVRLTVDGIGDVTRSYAEKDGGAFAVEGFTGTSQIQQQALFIKLQTTPEYLAAVLDTSVFLELDHVRAKALVLSLLNLQVQVGERSYALDELDQQYKQAFEDRKVAKKLLQQCVLPPKPPAVAMSPVEAIEEQLRKLRTALGTWQQTVGGVTGRRAALEAEASRVNAVVDAPAVPDVSGLLAERQAALKALEEATVPAPPAVAPAAGDPQRLVFLRSSVQLLQGHTPAAGCVLDRDVPCKTPPKAFRDRQATLEAEVRAIPPPQTSSPQAPPENPLTALRREIATLERQQAQREAQMETDEKATRRLGAIHDELGALPKTDTQQAEIATLTERIAKGEALLREARAHWAGVKLYETWVTERTARQAEVDRLEALVEQLGPNGVRAASLADAIGTFTAAVNPYLEPFGWTVTFQVDPWSVLANGLPVETYSKSERYRIGIALQMGIAMLSGLKCAVIDEMDMLDLTNRDLVSRMLLAAQLDQIIILGTREPSQVLPRMDGVLAYRLGTDKHGQSVILEHTGGKGKGENSHAYTQIASHGGGGAHGRVQ